MSSLRKPSPPSSLTDAEHAQRCYQDPAFWLEEVCGVEPTDQQREIFSHIAYPGAHVAVASGHGIGKSTALAALSLWFLATRENAKVPCTAPTAHQLEDILWSEIRRLIDLMNPWMKEQFTVTKGKVEVAGSTGFVVARTARPEKPDALQGFHGENLLFIIDEAAGVDEKVFEVAHGALSTPSARVVCTGNPTSLSGFFYKIFHGTNKWFKFHFSSLDSPLVDKSYAQTVKLDYGEDSDAYRVRVLGQFPIAGKSNLIPMDAVRRALARSAREDEISKYGVVLGVDPAWEGDDRSVIAMRQGRYAKILFAQSKVDGDLLARKALQFATYHNAQYIFIDKGGVGASCCDFLKVRGISHIRVHFDMSPDDNQFLNKRVEMWWRLRQWMERDDVTLINHEGLLDDLIAPEYGVRDNGKTYMESKAAMRKRGVRSPDLGDSLALTFFLPYNVTARLGGSMVRMNTFSDDLDIKWRREALGAL